MNQPLREPEEAYKGRLPFRLDDEPRPGDEPEPAAREQEDSIKDRKRLLFEPESPQVSAFPVDRKPFGVHLRETPALPVPGGVKAMLWAAGVVVGLLLAAAAYKVSQPKPRPEPKAVRTEPRPRG